MSLSFLQKIIENDFDNLQEQGGFSIDVHCPLPDPIWLSRRVEMIKKDFEQHKWMYRAVVRKDSNSMIGHISFHHKVPDPDLLGISEYAVELGYTITPVCRRMGFAKESAIAMMEWAYRNSAVKTFVLTISPSNYPSLQMAESMGFVKKGERMDEFDGLEYTMVGDIQDIFKMNEIDL